MTKGCSTPEGVIVSIAREFLELTPRQVLLNARGRHRLDRDRPRRRCAGGFHCSTPEGVIVSIAGCARPVELEVGACSTPEGVIVSIAPGASRRRPGRRAAQRPRASSSRSRHALAVLDQELHLLNARGRHRLDRVPPLGEDQRVDRCSTPEGVIVSIAGASSTRTTGSGSAQRPRASSSRSRAPWRFSASICFCSTPEGVIVSIAPAYRATNRKINSAQRPRASSSRSRTPATPRVPHVHLLNARGRHRLDRTAATCRRFVSSTAQRPRASSSRSRPDVRRTAFPWSDCSTPEGVIVSIASGFTS